MHESSTVADLVAAAERFAPGGAGAITHLRIRIGALAAATADSVRQGVATRAAARWHTAPHIEVELSSDPTEPGAHGVTLVSLQVSD